MCSAVAERLTALGAAVLGTSGCRQSQEKGRLFAVSFQVMNNPFFVDLDAGLREVIEAHERGTRHGTTGGPSAGTAP